MKNGKSTSAFNTFFLIFLFFSAFVTDINARDVQSTTADKKGKEANADLTSVYTHTPPESRDYYLGPDDALKITVYREEELDREVRVSSDGYISFPLLGKIKAEGLTVSELENVLTNKLRKYLKKPQVTIFIREYSSITVTGQVRTPGSYPLKGGVTVIEAISLAGGFTEHAADNDVKIIRTVDGKRKTLTVRVGDISEKGDRTKDVFLKRNDVIFVPEEYNTFTVTGHVRHSGSYPLKGGVTVIEAISLAGGFTEHAADNDVKIIRTVNGKRKTLTVRVGDISEKGNRTDDILLERNDVIFVPEEYKTFTVAGQVRQPGSYPLKGGISVIDAISIAGGFTKYASRNKVKLMRIENSENTGITLDVAAISKDGDKTRDVPLKSGDIIFVPESLF